MYLIGSHIQVAKCPKIRHLTMFYRCEVGAFHEDWKHIRIPIRIPIWIEPDSAKKFAQPTLRVCGGIDLCQFVTECVAAAGPCIAQPMSRVAICMDCRIRRKMRCHA
jgi:hypothetical protein